jgi:hypothetical protein
MSAPTTAAWEKDEFWKEVVSVLTRGKKLRPDSYLQRLSAEELQLLYSVLSSGQSFAEQVKAAPKFRGGSRDGEAPSDSTLHELSKAMRQVWALRRLEGVSMVQAATQRRGELLGLDPKITNAVCQIVAEEALAQEAAGRVGDFAISAAHVLMARESGISKAELEKEKIKLRQQAEDRAERALQLEINKYLDLAAEKLLDQALRKRADEINASSMSQTDKIAAMRAAAFKDVEALRASGKLQIPK